MQRDTISTCQKRSSRIEGQVRGLARMLGDDRCCIDVITRISAVRAALGRLAEEIPRDHAAHCAELAIASGNGADQRQEVAGPMVVLARSKRQRRSGRIGSLN